MKAPSRTVSVNICGEPAELRAFSQDSARPTLSGHWKIFAASVAAAEDNIDAIQDVDLGEKMRLKYIFIGRDEVVIRSDTRKYENQTHHSYLAGATGFPAPLAGILTDVPIRVMAAQCRIFRSDILEKLSPNSGHYDSDSEIVVKIVWLNSRAPEDRKSDVPPTYFQESETSRINGSACFYCPPGFRDNREEILLQIFSLGHAF